MTIIILYFIQITHTDDFPSTGRPYLASSTNKGPGVQYSVRNRSMLGAVDVAFLVIDDFLNEGCYSLKKV